MVPVILVGLWIVSIRTYSTVNTWILSKRSCIFKLQFWQYKHNSLGSSAGMTALEMTFFTNSNCTVCASKKVSVVRGARQGLPLYQKLQSLFHMASRDRGNILYRAVRDGELRHKVVWFSKERGYINFPRSSFRGSLELWLREAQWLPSSLMLLEGWCPGTWWDGYSQLDQTSHE